MKVLDYLLYSFYPEKCISCNKIIGVNEIFCKDCEFVHHNNYGQKIGDSFLPKIIYSVIYEDGIKNSIWKYKFRSHRYFVRPFSRLLFEIFDYYYKVEDFDVIIPVPITKKKLKERGYNHAGLLGLELSKLTGIPYYGDGLTKLRETNQHQKTLTERSRNVKGAYEVSKKVDLSSKRVLLVDDIITTGYTMKNCARLIKKAGAKSVFGITLASAGREPLAKYR
ncbi:MAG: ComF family protein [Oscillospiraceae bacterium]|nr:ComF family protein [Oscillospiraceae bacterium]